MNAINTNCTFAINDFNEVKKKMLNWANRFGIFCFLDNHGYQIPPQTLECILAVHAKRKFSSEPGNALAELDRFIKEKKSWLFGHLSYDLKNEIEDLQSENPDHLFFPGVFFFEPEILIRLTEKNITIEHPDAEVFYQEIIKTLSGDVAGETSVLLNQRISRQEYTDTIEQLKKHILRGDCYEINYCQEFYSENVIADPLQIYYRLSSVSPNPFSALYKLDDKWLICASPERYLKKTGNRVLSQPIKGTSVRHRFDSMQDEISKKELFQSQKERSENVMVVDLVRNDLSKICNDGTVQVDELFGIYSFPQVHQMISTISGELKNEISFAEVVRATFPMGSMTGAPKKSVMQLIERYEKTKRGIFSGALGYINPEGDFDFNVVIRSILYNETQKYLSFQAGSGITFYSDPENEYRECLLKAEAMKAALGQGSTISASH